MNVVLPMSVEQIRKDIHDSQLLKGNPHQDIIIPGLAAAVGNELKQSTGRNVIVGPIRAAELPLFLADQWRPPGKRI
ncbi:MAG: hypothetical protein HWN68_17530 [Desulfobacterales bacterium]|nr:hypothetical protein [Desulfobacterales bacterium]